MIRHISKVLLNILAGVSTTLAILFVVAAFLLSRGPLSVGFWVPYVADALESDDSPYQVSLDDAVLTWGGWKSAVQLRAVGLKVTDQAGLTHAEIPELTIGFSVPALLHGQLAPTSLVVMGPRLMLLRGEDGAITFTDPPPAEQGKADADTPVVTQENQERPEVSAELVSNIFADILAPPGPTNKLGYLTSLRVIDADITLADRKLDLVWHAPSSTLLIMKRDNGIFLSGLLGIHIGGEIAEFTLNGAYNTEDEVISADLLLSDIQPALFAATAPLFEPLAGIKLPLSGVLRLRAGFDGTVQLFALDVSGGAGTVLWPGEASDAAVPVRSLRLRAGLIDDLTSLQIDELRIDLGGASLAASGSIQGVTQGIVDGPFELFAELTTHNLTVADLKRLWPSSVEPNVHAWISENISEGLITDGKFSLTGAAGDDGLDSFDIADLFGEFRYTDMVLSYFDTLPAVRRGQGTAVLTRTGLSFAVTGGEVQGLQVASGTVDITGFDRHDQWLALEVVVRGPVLNVLTILDHRRLDYVKGMGIKPTDVGGQTAVRLALRFPLIAALTFKEVEIAAAAALREISLSKAAFDLDLTGGDLQLQLDGRGMEVEGTGVLGAIPISLQWSENFTPRGYARRFKVLATMDNADRRSIGLDLDDYLRGPVAVDAVLTQYPSKANDLVLAADITPAVLEVEALGWRKEPGVLGAIKANLALTGDLPTVIRDFTLDGDGFKSRGMATFAADGKTIDGAKFSELRYGRSDILADIARRDDGGLDIAIKGKSFDASHVVKGDQGGDKQAPSQPSAATVDVLPLSIVLNAETVHVSEEGALANVTARLQRDKKHWRMIRIDGQPGPDKTFSLDLAPDGDNRRLQIRSNDAGSVFKMLNISGNILSGQLQLNGSYDDSKPESPLLGSVEVTSFRLVRAPVIAKLLSVAFLTGILDSLRGEGIGFDRMEASFTMRNDVLETSTARAHGSALGLTAQGWVNLANQTIGMRGTIVPAYAVNSILNNIPLIGTLLGGSGSGIFAATYRMTGGLEDPDIAVNPLATLTPGFLRGLFRIFEGGVPPQPEALPDPSLEREAPLPAPRERFGR